MMLGDGVIEQGLEQRGAFSVGNAPGDDPAAENIDDDVEIYRESLRIRKVACRASIFGFGLAA